MSPFDIQRIFSSDDKKANLAASVPSKRKALIFSRPGIGRDEAMDWLRVHLIGENPAPVMVCAPEGYGKTQLAATFAENAGKQFSGVFWVVGGPFTQIGVEIARCGQSLEIHHWPENLADQVQTTIHAWQTTTPPPLIIFDNIHDLSQMAKFLPDLQSLQVLVLYNGMCDETVPINLEYYSVPKFTSHQAVALLRELSPHLAKLPKANLRQLANSLNNIPLTITLASKVFNANPKMLPDQVRDAISQSPQHSTQSLSGLAEMIKLVLNQLSGEKDRFTRQILFSVAYCAPSYPIPSDFLSHCVGKDQMTQPPIQRTIRRLLEWGLVDGTADVLSMHPAVSGVLRGLGGTESLASLQNLVITLLEQSQQVDKQTESSAATHTEGKYPAIGSTEKVRSPLWPLWPHVWAASTYAEMEGISAAGNLWRLLGHHHWQAQYLDLACQALEHALSMDEKIFGLVHTETTADAQSLGEIFFQRGDYKSSERFLKRAITSMEQVYSPAYPQVAYLANLLGLTQMQFGDYAAARAYFERALEIHETAFGYGPKHPSTALDLNQLGHAFRGLGKPIEARHYYQRALEIDEWVYGPQNPIIAGDCNNIGRALNACNAHREAVPFFQRALAIIHNAYGPNHPDVATNLNHLGLTAHLSGHLSEAREHLQLALAIDERLPETQQSAIARDLNNLGSVLRDLKELDIARACFERALTISQKMAGPLHGDVAIYANNLARILYTQGDLPQARVHFERVLQMDEHIYGPSSPEVASDLGNIGTVLQDQKDYYQARLHFERALQILEKALPAEHAKLQRARKNLARVRKQIEDQAAKPL